MSLTKEEINKHSLLAAERWKSLWINNSLENKPYIKNSQSQLLGKFNDKRVYLFSYGSSFLKNLTLFKKSNDYGKAYVKVGCVDKALRPMLENGVIPDFVLLADASVNVKWLEGSNAEYLKNTYFISNVYGNPDWTKWWIKNVGEKNIYWYLNKDNINTQDFYSGICGYGEMIEAGSNVGNSLIIFTVKIFGSKEIILNGYDYSWKNQYYGTVDSNKKNWLGMIRPVNCNGDIVFQSSNMEFSSKWLGTYIMFCKQEYNVDIYNATNGGMLGGNICTEWLN
jgi:hypothetical protein